MNEIEVKDIADELLIINKTTIERLFQQENLNSLILYLFYYKTAKWQKTTTIKANDEYCKKCLHWGIDKLKIAKKILVDMELIEVIKTFDKNNKISGWYVKVKYFNSTIPISTIPNFPQLGKQETNTINNNILNTNNKKEINKEIYEIIETINDEDLKTSVKEWLEYKTERKEKYKILGFKKLISQIQNNANKYGVDQVCELIDICMANNWAGIIFDKLKGKSKPQEKKSINDLFDELIAEGRIKE